MVYFVEQNYHPIPVPYHFGSGVCFAYLAGVSAPVEYVFRNRLISTCCATAMKAMLSV